MFIEMVVVHVVFRILVLVISGLVTSVWEVKVDFLLFLLVIVWFLPLDA